jgi:hypothetical protein
MTDINASELIIEDSKLYTNFTPNAIINNEIRRKNITTNRQYREYLQRNTLNLIDYNFKTDHVVLGNNIPYTFNSVNDSSRPFGYETSEPKQKFLYDQAIFASQTRPMRSNYA